MRRREWKERKHKKRRMEESEGKKRNQTRFSLCDVEGSER